MRFAADMEEMGGARRYRVRDREVPISFARACELWSESAEFAAWFNDLLAAVPFRAFRWETPPATLANQGRAFEFVVLDCPGLERRADSTAFAAQLESLPAAEMVAAFPNLGNDAFLIVPRAIAAPSAYPHLGAFVRSAPEEQRLALWRAVGLAVQSRLGARPLWLSTAGMGVPWLHVRLDSRPKYYAHAPYTRSE
jgi:hypothetical protein